MRDPIEPLFPQSLLDALRQSPGGPAFEQGDRSVSRGELLDLIGRLAGAMRRAGLGPGRGIAVHLAVSPEAFAAHIAAHVLGCRVVAVRPRYAAGQLAHVLGMDVDYVLVDATTVETSAAALLTAPEPAPLLSLGPCPSAIDLLAQPGDGGDLRVTARPDDVAALVFTSGSTGRPKGCAITYRALSSHWTWQPRAWSPAAAEFAMAFERYLLFGTLASMVVLEFLAPCLLGGGTAVIPDDDGRPLFPYAIERYRITGSIITVPRLSQMLDVLRRQQVYVRAPYQMTRYWGQEEETQDTLRDGWLRTRDLGYQDADGFLYLVGRTRDVIMVNAMVVYAGPIEQVLMGHPDVAEAYVAGAPDERSGEAVHAFVVLDGRRTPDLDALTALVRAELGEDSVPRTITVVPGVPMAATGKPDKRALLAMHGMPPRASPLSGLG